MANRAAQSTTPGGRVDFANTLRGLASVCVLIAHYFGVFWAEPDVVQSLIFAPAAAAQAGVPAYFKWLFGVPYLSWGAFGVALFFLVSGFVIPFSLKNATWASFLVGRLFRILPLYAAGFSVTLFAIYLASRLYGFDWPFSLEQVVVHYFPGIRDALFSRDIDGVVWTLEIEVRFYLVCAAAIVLFRRRSLWVFAVPVALAAIALALSVLGNGIRALSPAAYHVALAVVHTVPYICFMFIGSVFHYIHIGRLRPLTALLPIAAMFGLYVLTVWAGPYRGDLILALNYGFAVLFFAFAARFPGLFRASAVADFFASISYPLYTIHAIAGFVTLHVLVDHGFPPWAATAIVVAAALLVAWLLHVIVEEPSHRFGKSLARRLTVSRTAPSPSPG